MVRRVVLIVLDSFGIGEGPDAYLWTEGLNTLCVDVTSSHVSYYPSFSTFLHSHAMHLQGQIRAYVPVTVLDHTQATPLETGTCRLTSAAA